MSITKYQYRILKLYFNINERDRCCLIKGFFKSVQYNFIEGWLRDKLTIFITHLVVLALANFNENRHHVQKFVNGDHLNKKVK
jgi:hypothetical protein